MTLMPVHESPVLRMISKAAELDPAGTAELVRLALYETLCDQVDYARVQLDQDIAAYVAKQDDSTRRAIVRAYIDRRMAGEDVEDLLEISKSVAQDDDKKTKWWDARDLLGRFTRADNGGAARLSSALSDVSTARESKDPFDQPRYANLRATGAALSSLGPGADVKLVGATASALGALGPEAEKVLGQGLRRTAYRYRGSEKRPDKGLKTELANALKIIDPEKQAMVDAVMAARGDEEIKARALSGKPFDRDRSDTRAVAPEKTSVAVANFWRKQPISQDQKELATAGDVAAQYYLSKLPDAEATAISIAAGALPPSQGVIIDADGDVVSEAMGYNGDHYVPFDLKNLRSLQGGQYVRTRASGGPTTEDIYTGLLSGARQVQVVSQSGVFTLEFDPSIRGGRRYSDKARQMVGRYQKILDAVDAGPKAGLYQQDLDPAVVREIRRDAAQSFPDPADAAKYASTKINEARAAQSFQMKGDDEIDDEVDRRLKGKPHSKQDVVDTRREVMDEERKKGVKAFQLDGDGYEAALKALKTEFPYFIRQARREPLPEFVSSRGMSDKTKYSGAKDRGYVSPTNAASGLADKVTVTRGDRKVQRGFYKTPLKGQEDAPVSEGTDDAPQSAGGPLGTPPAGAQTPASDHVRLDQALGHRKVAAVVNRGASSLSDAAELFATPADAILPPLGDPEREAEFSATMSPKLVIAQVFNGFTTAKTAGSVSTFADYLTKVGPNEREKLKHALPRVPSLIGAYVDVDAEEKQAASESAELLHELLEITSPLPQGDVLEHDPMANENLPVQIKDFAKLTTDLDAFEAEARRIKLEESEVDRMLGVMSRTSAETTAEQISDLLDKHDDEKSEQSAAKVVNAQRAFTFHTLRERAKTLNRLMGSPGKAPAPRAGAAQAPDQDRVLKSARPLQWHRPGSQVATEFQKFLAQQ